MYAKFYYIMRHTPYIPFLNLFTPPAFYFIEEEVRKIISKYMSNLKKASDLSKLY